MKTKINLRYLDDGNLSDDRRIVLKVFKIIVEAEKPTISLETFEYVSLTKVIEKWLKLINEQESPLYRSQKKRTQPVNVKTGQDLIFTMNNKRSKVFSAHKGKLGSHWPNVVPCKNLRMKLDDQQLRISIGLRLGANICVAHTYHCNIGVERDGLQIFLAPRVLALLTSCNSHK